MAIAFRWGAFVVLAAGPLAVPAYAQQAVAPQFDIRLSATARYDSNVGSGSDATNALRGIVPEDQRISPSISVDIVRPLGSRSAVNLNGHVGYDFYRRNSQLNRENIELNAGSQTHVAVCDVNLGTGISRRQTDLADLTLQTLPVGTTAENVETVFNASADLQCGNEYGLRPLAGINYSRGRNSNVLRNFGERNTVGFHAGLGYVSPAIGELRVVATRQDIDYPGRPLIAGEKDGYRHTSVNLEYERDIGARITASAHVGYTRVTPVNPIASKFKGTNFGAEITALVGARMRVTAEFDRDVGNSLNSDSSYSINNHYGVTVAYALTERLRLRAVADFLRQDYRYATAPATDFIDLENRRTFSLGATYAVTPRVNLELSGGTLRRNANGTVFDYSNTFATLGLSVRI